MVLPQIEMSAQNSRAWRFQRSLRSVSKESDHSMCIRALCKTTRVALWKLGIAWEFDIREPPRRRMRSAPVGKSSLVKRRKEKAFPALSSETSFFALAFPSSLARSLVRSSVGSVFVRFHSQLPCSYASWQGEYFTRTLPAWLP